MARTALLKKIIAVENIGPFQELKHEGESWRKAVVIDGENTTGKTTLSAVLSAACSKDSRAISVRKAVASQGHPHVKLLLGTEGTRDADRVVSFDRGTWSAACPELLVFNRGFVHANVYVGREIGADQREGLYERAIGARAVQAKEAVESASRRHREAKKKKEELSRDLAVLLSPVGATFADLRLRDPLIFS